MPSNALRPTMFDPLVLWADLALKTTEMWLASGQVIGTRLGRISQAGSNPSARDIKEFTLMGTEKVTAATQSALAVATRMQSANYQLMARGWQQWPANLSRLSSDAARLFGAALAPVHSAATANAKRLGRTRALSKR